MELPWHSITDGARAAQPRLRMAGGRAVRFDVPIALPLVGLVIHYTCWLAPDA